MIRPISSAIITGLVLIGSYAQALSPAEKKIADDARSRYYNLQASGFGSLTCNVTFDFDSIPFSSLPNSLKSTLHAAPITLNIDDRGLPSIKKQLPSSVSKEELDQATQTLNVMSALVAGVFQTWPTKGLFGPIPPFDKQISSVKTTADGYIFDLNVPGGPVLITTDKKFSTTQISSVGGRVLEKTTYSPSGKGLVFTGDKALSKKDGEPAVEVEYHLETQVLDGLIVPAAVHAIVKPNIDARYTLTSCKVTKETVIGIK